jgi:hypothetical protein
MRMSSLSQRLIRCAVLAALGIGCSTASEETAARVGLTRAQLLAELGAPTNSAEFSDGREVLSWLEVRPDDGTVCRKNYFLSVEDVVEEATEMNCGRKLRILPER